MASKGKIFIVEDDKLVSSMTARALKKEGYEVQAEQEDFSSIVARIRSYHPDIILLDISLRGRNGIDILQELKEEKISAEVIMLTSDDSAETAVKCMKSGAVDYVTKPFNVEEVKIIVGNIAERRKLKNEVNYLRKVYSELFDEEIIGESEGVRSLNARLEKIALARVPSILITGESGTGKELVARQIHRKMSEGCTSGCLPFIAVNCTALPEHLLESELFGYEKGAFTDARTEKKGLFELANRGTVLLDEVGDMKTDLQSKLLRVLEDRKIRRLGGQEEIPIEVTVIATTNRDLSQAVERGDFRIDLLYRLNTFAIHVPPLREKREDISPLSHYFLAYFTAKYRNTKIKGISPEAENVLRSYDWPGNVRELRNVIERVVVLENSKTIMPEHLPKEITRMSSSAGPSEYLCVLPEGGLSLERLESELFRQAMEQAKNNKTLAAKLLNVSYDTLRYHIKKFGLKE
jgi:DNA-binding NtrC family response regulator